MIVNTPCNDRKELQKIKMAYIILHYEKYGNKLLNKKCNSINKKKKNGMYVVDTVIKGMRVATKSKFNKHEKQIHK